MQHKYLFQTPQHEHGLLGDLSNLLLAPVHLLSHLPKLLTQESDYVSAQVDGRMRGNCTRYAERCPSSVFEVAAFETFDFSELKKIVLRDRTIKYVDRSL